MKKYWIAIFLISLLFLPKLAKAEKMLIEVVDDFSSKNPQSHYSLTLLTDLYVKNGHSLEKGSIIKGKTLEVIPPKRLRKDAYFIFIADSFTIPSENHKVVEIQKKMESKIKYHKKGNAKEIVSNTGIIAASHFVPVLNIIVPVLQFGAGIATPKEDENRLHSGCRSLVESWPICYCLKGEEVEIESGSTALFYFDPKMFEL